MLEEKCIYKFQCQACERVDATAAVTQGCANLRLSSIILLQSPHYYTMKRNNFSSPWQSNIITDDTIHLQIMI